MTEAGDVGTSEETERKDDMGIAREQMFKSTLHFTVLKICLMLEVKTLCPCLMAFSCRQHDM